MKRLTDCCENTLSVVLRVVSGGEGGGGVGETGGDWGWADEASLCDGNPLVSALENLLSSFGIVSPFAAAHGTAVLYASSTSRLSNSNLLLLRKFASRNLSFFLSVRQLGLRLKTRSQLVIRFFHCFPMGSATC